MASVPWEERRPLDICTAGALNFKAAPPPQGYVSIQLPGVTCGLGVTKTLSSFLNSSFMAILQVKAFCPTFSETIHYC